eukprot:TRINITY_DN4834_c0_g1_i3.p1 TRINITY_DN4834_c0_g1~~TRINITY_DN4834_c0_g1_i3.p1  ORF type:complete len:655 (+),score=172.11 TRINITY_DN4834_c0_g1_i3:541-2505(+)
MEREDGSIPHHHHPSNSLLSINQGTELSHESLQITRSKNGENSPESGSLYSDEIPSGYNSGEQYDTLSTGYMSGEAYELPETRMDLREPTLGNLAEEENEGETQQHRSASRMTSSDSSERAEGDCEPKFSLMRPNKVAGNAFSIPMIDAPLDGNEGLYKAVPSDTDDTSAFESDANRRISMEEGCLSGDGGMTTSDSGAELLGGFKRRMGRRSRRYGNSHSGHKKPERDEEWFSHNDTKIWGLARGICFWGAILSIVFCIVTAGVVIAQMPKSCDPEISWYQGGVSAELSFQDFSSTSMMSSEKILELKEFGIRNIVLRDKEDNNKSESTKDFLDNRVPEFFKNESLASELMGKLHDHDMNLIVEIHVVGDGDMDREYVEEGRLSLELQHTVAKAIKFWSQRGVDGIFLMGLGHFVSDKWIGEALSDWRTVMAKYGTSSQHKILITELDFTLKTEDKLIMDKMDLLDATLHIPEPGNIIHALEDIFNITSWDTPVKYPWINWNLNSVRPLSNSLLALQMMLPGSVNVLKEDIESPAFKELASLRLESVPIYMNGNYKRCDCAESYEKERNFEFKWAHNGSLLQLERFYNRRNRFVYVGNFGGNESIYLESIGKMYSGGTVRVFTGGLSNITGNYAEFKDIVLEPGEALVMMLPK